MALLERDFLCALCDSAVKFFCVYFRNFALLK